MTQETVYVSRGSTREAYHTDPDCSCGIQNPKPWDRDTAESWGLRLCKECAGVDYRTGGKGALNHE